jgi:hypothetical protein
MAAVYMQFEECCYQIHLMRRKNKLKFFLLEMVEERQTPIFCRSHVKTPWNKHTLASMFMKFLIRYTI